MRGPDEWYEPSLIDISDSRSAESQSVISGDNVKSLARTTFDAAAAVVAVDIAEAVIGREVDGW